MYRTLLTVSEAYIDHYVSIIMFARYLFLYQRNQTATPLIRCRSVKLDFQEVLTLTTFLTIKA